MYRITKLKKNDILPFHLLLLGDETREAINRYIHDSDVYAVHKPEIGDPVAVFVLYPVNANTLEIKNIAVSKALQGRGIGGYLMRQIETIAGSTGYQEIIVGTPDVAAAEIRFYEKNGYIKYGIRKNFFTENYPDPIIENGVVLKDMQMLRKVMFTQ